MLEKAEQDLIPRCPTSLVTVPAAAGSLALVIQGKSSELASVPLQRF